MTPGAPMVMETRAPVPVRHTVRVALAIFNFPMLNVGLRAAINAEPDMEVVCEIEDRQSVRDELQRANADLVITECMPFTTCAGQTTETIELIRRFQPDMKILTVEFGSSSDQFSLALKAGADGFLTRDTPAADVINAIRCVNHGNTYVSPSIVTKMVDTYLLKTPQSGLADPYDSLTDREHEVLLLAAVGHTNREIAKIFHLSEQTIHNYRAELMEKLGFHDRVELLKFAIRRGIINVADL